MAIENQVYAQESGESGHKTLEPAREYFKNEGLPFPLVPKAFVSAFGEVGPGIFGTRVPENGLYPMELFFTELRTTDVDDYLLMGFDGHGFASWAMHYYLVQGPLALFLQLSWGNAFEAPGAPRREIEGSLELAEYIVPEMEAAVSSGALPEHQRLIIVDSSLTLSRWAWAPDTPFEEDQVEWHDEFPVMVHAFSSLQSLRSA
jgi:hypothetical protein